MNLAISKPDFFLSSSINGLRQELHPRFPKIELDRGLLHKRFSLKKNRKKIAVFIATISINSMVNMLILILVCPAFISFPLVVSEKEMSKKIKVGA